MPAPGPDISMHPVSGKGWSGADSSYSTHNAENYAGAMVVFRVLAMSLVLFVLWVGSAAAQPSAPSVTLSAPGPNIGGPTIVTIVFSEAVTGFTLGDFVVTNGTLSSLQTSDNMVYTVTLHPTWSASLTTIMVPAGVAVSVGGVPNTASNVLIREYVVGPVDAVDDFYTGTRDTPLIVPVSEGVLSNDVGQGVYVSLHVAPVNGTVWLSSDGRFTYTPSAGFVGTDTFQVWVHNGFSDDYSTVHITIEPAAPIVSGVSPAMGPLAGGTEVTITGSSLTGVDGVLFGAVPATAFTVNSDTAITATVPSAGAGGPVDVTVTRGAESATLPGGYLYEASPVGTVTIRQETSGSDAVFGFTSATAALNVSVATSGGAGSSSAVALPPGNYRVTADDMSGAGYALAGLVCDDGNSTGDVASRTVSIELEAGEAVVCTFTSVNSAERTEDLIGQFLEERARFVLANQPDTGRRIDRLNGVAAGGRDLPSALMGYVSQLGAEGPPTVSTSLNAIGAMAGARKPSPFDVWLSGSFAVLDGDGGGSTAAIGADYLVNPDLLVGGFIQVDRMAMDLEDGAEASGTGWLAGPYVTARLAGNLYLDLLAAAGRSSNTISPFGTYENAFDATRYLLSATLEGQWQWDGWTFSPRARLSYFEETGEGYIDGMGVPVDPVTTGLGQLAVGPGISYRFVTEGEVTIDTGMRFEGILDIAHDDELSLGNLNGRFEGTLAFGFAGGARLGLSAAYEGIGGDHQSTGGRLTVSLPMQ